MTVQEAEQLLSVRLRAIYEEGEANAISGLIMENISGWGKMDRIINKSSPLSVQSIDLLEQYTSELLSHRPVQYVLHEAWFYRLKFYVSEKVLIPRPETEELVEWILDQPSGSGQSVLDVGTGSGCIAIALKKKEPGIQVFACDLSRDALEVAKLNAISNQVSIELIEIDFLKEDQRESLPFFESIVANPPYIPIKEKDAMERNVVDFEPHLALFVPGSDPLVFYRALADFGSNRLLPGGRIFAEIPDKSAADIKKLFSFKGYSSIEIRTDMQGKQRLLKATLLP